MPKHIEVETKELQDAIQEQHHSEWVRYVGLTTAILAAFAAVGALQSGALINEAMINQIKASDTWNEYQASRQKEHAYTIALNGLLDSTASNFKPRTAVRREKEYRSKIADESKKERERFPEARRLEAESAHQVQKQHYFEYSVALIQVAIALGAIATLARVKGLWYGSILGGAIGIALLVIGFAR